jgi:hypothetical protein
MIATLTGQINEYMDENAERAYESLEKVLVLRQSSIDG